MESVTYTKGELKKIIVESSSEFKAKLGDGVESSNKTEAGKTYKDAKKRVKDYDGGGKEDYWKGDAKYEKEDYNGTTLDYNPENVDEKWKKRVHAQVKGYTSEAEMNNKEEKIGDFSDNENIYNGIKKSGKEKHKKIEDLKKSGLQASKMPDGTFKKEEMYESKDGFDMRNIMNRLNNNINKTVLREYDGDDFLMAYENLGVEVEEGSKLEEVLLGGYIPMDEMESFAEMYQDDPNSEDLDKYIEPNYKNNTDDEIAGLPSDVVNENKKVKTITFKKTKFINEDYMRNRIPDEFKKNGCVFRMKDKVNNNYLLEWKNGKAVILEHNNKNGMNESLSRMNELMSYQTKTNETNSSVRLNEDSRINDTLNKIRNLMK